jgi:hypothetical protein
MCRPIPNGVAMPTCLPNTRFAILLHVTGLDVLLLQIHFYSCETDHATDVTMHIQELFSFVSR